MTAPSITAITLPLTEIVSAADIDGGVHGVLPALVRRDRAEFGDARDIQSWALSSGTSKMITSSHGVGEQEARRIAAKALETVPNGTVVVVPFNEVADTYPTLIEFTVSGDDAADAAEAFENIREQAENTRPADMSIHSYASVTVRVDGVYVGGVWERRMDLSTLAGWVVSANITTEHDTEELEAMRREQEAYDRMYPDWD